MCDNLINCWISTPIAIIRIVGINKAIIGDQEVTSSTPQTKLQKQGKYLPNGLLPSRRPMALIANDRRDSGTVSDVSRKSSMASQCSRKASQVRSEGAWLWT